MTGSREEMFAKFQPWVLATYGDSAKTKTITARKALRIKDLLLAEERGDGGVGEPAGSEAAKFRLWVKSKGLQLGKDVEGEEPALFIPTGTDKVGKNHCTASHVTNTLKFGEHSSIIIPYKMIFSNNAKMSLWIYVILS